MINTVVADTLEGGVEVNLTLLYVGFFALLTVNHQGSNLPPVFQVLFLS